MQFINRSLLVAAAALALAQSTVAAPFQSLSKRAAPTDYTGPGVYTITNNATGTNVDLYNGGTAAGTAITGWTPTANIASNPHQQWRIAEEGSYLIITNVGTGSLIAADPNVYPTLDGPLNKLTGLPPSGPVPLYAKWMFNGPNPDGYKGFVNGQYYGAQMDLAGARSADGTPVLCYPVHGLPGQGIAKNQRWILNRIGN